MALESDAISSKSDNEEDVGCYFLQPSSSPYNITEKVQQANFDLFNSTPQASRSMKVKFRDELVSFEPDLTDDDVNSIESDHVVDDLSILSTPPEYKEEQNVAYNTVLRAGMDIYNIEEEIDDTVIEELILSDEEEEHGFNGKENPALPPDEEESTHEDASKRSRANSDTVSSRKSVKRKKRSAKIKKQEVHCKEHCIERLDTHLSMSIQKLQIHEKPLVGLPPLQLHQRKCCDEIKLSERNLPNYNGYRSEYGLSSRQIKNRDRYVQMIRQKEMARQKLIEEYRTLKIRQNEEVFCQWLKEVSKRSKQSGVSQQVKTRQKRMSANYSPSPAAVNAADKSKGRPKTAGLLPKTGIKKKKRPHTSQSRVYIEISPNILEQGLHVGDLLITSSKELQKKLHVLAVS